MADIVQVRRDTAANWTSANPTLANGEQGYETDTSKMKVGDGATVWTSLSYFADAAGTTLPVADTQTIVKGSVDTTKLMRFEVDGLTTATTRVLTVQNKDVTICDNADLTTHTVGANPHSGSAASGANSDITSIAGLTTDLSIAQGGTGQSTAQAAIDALSQVAGGTNEHVLTKDTGTGNATWKVGGSSSAKTMHFADNGLFIPFSRISPAGIYHDGMTYITWQGKPNNMDPYVIGYDHSTKQWSSKVKVGDNQLGNDDHGAPCIIRDSTGYLHVFYGAHNSSIQHAKSTTIDDITAWTQKTSIGTANAYNMVVASGSDLYLFYRHTATGRPIAYRKSTDAGESWSAENLIVQFASTDWCYCGGIDLESTTKIHVSWCYYDGSVRKNAYHAYLNLSDGNMYAMDGTNLGVQITNAEADANCLVYNSTGTTVANARARVDSSGIPYMMFYHDGKMKFTYWTGSAWATPTAISPAAASPDFIVHSSTFIEAYIVYAGYLGVHKWIWDGTDWHFDSVIYDKTATGGASSAKTILDGDPELKVVFGEEMDDYTTSLKVYAHGIDGFVKSVV